MVLGSIGSYVALVAGVYRLGRLCFGPLVGLLAGLLVLTRFFDENLCSMKFETLSMTPGTRSLSSGTRAACHTVHSCAWRGFAPSNRSACAFTARTRSMMRSSGMS
jgi:hypothetical protein